MWDSDLNSPHVDRMRPKEEMQTKSVGRKRMAQSILMEYNIGFLEKTWVGYQQSQRYDILRIGLHSEAVEGLSLAFECVYDVHGSHSLTAGVLGVCNSVANDGCQIWSSTLASSLDN
jgi:hypothetical protein